MNKLLSSYSTLILDESSPVDLKKRWDGQSKLIDLIVNSSISGKGQSKIDQLKLVKASVNGEVFDLIDLRGIKLSGLVLSGVDFSFCCLDHSEISDCQFIELQLQGASLNNTFVKNSSFIRTQANPVSWMRSRLERMKVADSFFMDSNFQNSQLLDVQFEKSYFDGSDLSNIFTDSKSKFIDTDFKGIQEKFTTHPRHARFASSLRTAEVVVVNFNGIHCEVSYAPQRYTNNTKLSLQYYKNLVRILELIGVKFGSRRQSGNFNTITISLNDTAYKIAKGDVLEFKYDANSNKNSSLDDHMVIKRKQKLPHVLGLA